MTLTQLHQVRAWHLLHWRQRSMERWLWDAILTLWLMGWVGMPVAVVIGALWVEPACIGMLCLPAGYAGLRERLHRSGRLRCDWLGALRV